MAEVARTNLSTEETVKKLQKAYQNLTNKTDVNVPSDPQYLKGFTEWGTPDYDWPPKSGFQEDTIEGINLVSQDQFIKLSDKYKKYLSDTTSSLNISENEIQYGVRGKAATWGDMSGGAEQLVTPFNGLDMKHLGMMETLR